MIEVLLKDCGVWVEIYTDNTATTEELDDLAREHGLIVGSKIEACLTDLTRIDCSTIAGVRVSR